MSTNKIQLVEVPEAKNVKKLLLAGTFMVVIPVITVIFTQGLANIDLSLIPGIWPELFFFVLGFFAFLRAYQLKRKQKMYFVEFSEHTITYRNKDQDQVWIDRKEMDKIEVGEYSASIHLKSGGQKIIRFEEAPEDNIPVIKQEFRDFL